MPTLLRHQISLRTYVLSLMFLFILVLLGIYVAYQARHVILGPLITIHEEPSMALVAPTFLLTGLAENIVSLSLNGRDIYTDDTGNFSETLVLPLGYTIMTLTAKDRYGRVHSVERTYVRQGTSLTHQLYQL